jgi:uncharacterized phage protein gp47/JayE
MPFYYKSFETFRSIYNAALRKALPEIDPTVKGSDTFAHAQAQASLAMTLQGLVQDVEKQMFPQSCDGDINDTRWGALENLPRLPATGARGAIAQPGTLGLTIPIDTQYQGNNNILYDVKATATVTTQGGSISTLTRVGTTVTALCASNHNLGTGLSVTIAGANQAEYNGTFQIIAVSNDTFTYEISGSPVTPATGTITWASEFALVTVQTDTTGIETNLTNGAALSVTNTITAIPAIVTYEGLVGGSSVEDDANYKSRIIRSRNLIEGAFTTNQVILAALGITGNTRVFVKNPIVGAPGGYLEPLPGQVSVFFLRDNDPNILPNQTIINETKQAIIDNGKMTCHTAAADIFVQVPALVTVNFTFTALDPDTVTMRSAVQANLKAFFEDTADFEKPITAAAYLAAIYNTQDLITNTFLTSFSLSAPTGDITVNNGEIAVLGTVDFSI